MSRYAAVIEYIGSEFFGSQFQPDKSTVQGDLENALHIYFKQKVKVVPSGRTDAGVHSKWQVAHFDIDIEKIDINKVRHNLNAILPKGMSIAEIVSVKDNFHAQKSAQYRYYRYVISNKPYRSVWDMNTFWVRENLNIENMQKALSFLLGEHDFSAFKSAGTKNPAKICTVYFAKLEKLNDYIYIDLIANRFLYNMVRIIVGTVLDIGRGKFTPQFINQLLISKDRNRASATIPPTGLTLMAVGYDGINSEGCETIVNGSFSLSKQLENTEYIIKEALWKHIQQSLVKSKENGIS